MVYLFDGDDEYALARSLREVIASLGDSEWLEMNTARLEGATLDMEQLAAALMAAPWGALQRLVIVTNPTARFDAPGARGRFLELLERTPSTTTVVLIEKRTLTPPKERQAQKMHWLEEWAAQRRDLVRHKHHALPKGNALIIRIQEIAAENQGHITPRAAQTLAWLVDGDLHAAEQEIHKLLAYVGYSRPIQEEDVHALTADANPGDIFALVDALALRNHRLALKLLRRLLDSQDYFAVFGMIVRQFRLLILAREALERGLPPRDIPSHIGVPPFVAEKLLPQARRWPMNDLENAMRRLLDTDLAVKCGQLSEAVALELFIASFAAAPQEKRAR